MKIYTRAEFEKLLRESAREMAGDEKLQKAALEVLVQADRHRWIHQTKWMGEPLLNLPQDMFALQEIIFKTRPKFIVEVGTAWGGSLLFFSTLMEALGGEKVVGIDTYIPDDLKKRIGSFGRLSERIAWINGSSVDKKTVAEVKAIVGSSREVMVMLDSHHTHDHVLKELKLYSPLVGKGYYIVCGDTVVENMPLQEHRERPWGPGNNPKTALDEFLRGSERFQVDGEMSDKLLFTCMPGGYLRCVRD